MQLCVVPPLWCGAQVLWAVSKLQWRLEPREREKPSRQTKNEASVISVSVLATLLTNKKKELKSHLF